MDRLQPRSWHLAENTLKKCSCPPISSSCREGERFISLYFDRDMDCDSVKDRCPLGRNEDRLWRPLCRMWLCRLRFHGLATVSATTRREKPFQKNPCRRSQPIVLEDHVGGQHQFLNGEYEKHGPSVRRTTVRPNIDVESDPFVCIFGTRLVLFGINPVPHTISRPFPDPSIPCIISRHKRWFDHKQLWTEQVASAQGVCWKAHGRPNKPKTAWSDIHPESA